jgi:uncharacterized membrane protein YdbT with pleckstrin-like domain
MSKKNLQEGEVVIYQPLLHWFVLVKPVLFCLLALIPVIAKAVIVRNLGKDFFRYACNGVYVPVLVAIFSLGALYLLRQIIEFYMVQYYITNKRLILKKGIFTSSLIDLPIEKVESIIVIQSLLGRIFNYGNVFVSGIGGMLPGYRSVRKPYKVRRVLNKVIDKNRKITITREDQPKPVYVREVVKEVQKEDEIQYGTFVTSYPAGERQIPLK